MFYLENIFILLSTMWTVYRKNGIWNFFIETNLNLNMYNEVLFIYFSYLIFGKKLSLAIKHNFIHDSYILIKQQYLYYLF